MLIFIIIISLFTIGAFAIFNTFAKGYAKENDNYSCQMTKRYKTLRFITLIIGVVLIIIALIFGGIRIVDSTEIGVVRTFGEINKQITSGLNFVNPITDTVSYYDLRVHVREASFMSYTKDAQPLTAAIEYQHKLRPENVMDIAREYGSYEILESKLNNVVQEKAKIVFAKYGAMALLENRAELSAEVAEEVKELEELYYIEFTSVIVKDVDFSDAFEASVEAKMTAEQDALRAEQEKKTALVKAEQDKEVAVIEAEAAIARAEGEAQALEITRAALENMPDTWIKSLWIETWNGELPQLVTEGSNLMISPDIN